VDMEQSQRKGVRTIQIYLLGSAEVSVGPLRFDVRHRIVLVDGEEDHGASIDVYGPVDGKETELIKFDCFEKGPHYHAPADARPIDLDRSQQGNGLDWALATIREGLPELLAASGHAELARSLDRALLAARWTEVRDAVLATAPASYDPTTLPASACSTFVVPA
jgi:hypothetical protein